MVTNFTVWRISSTQHSHYFQFDTETPRRKKNFNPHKAPLPKNVKLKGVCCSCTETTQGRRYPKVDPRSDSYPKKRSRGPDSEAFRVFKKWNKSRFGANWNNLSTLKVSPCFDPSCAIIMASFDNYLYPPSLFVGQIGHPKKRHLNFETIIRKVFTDNTLIVKLPPKKHYFGFKTEIEKKLRRNFVKLGAIISWPLGQHKDFRSEY